MCGGATLTVCKGTCGEAPPTVRKDCWRGLPLPWRGLPLPSSGKRCEAACCARDCAWLLCTCRRSSSRARSSSSAATCRVTLVADVRALAV